MSTYSRDELLEKLKDFPVTLGWGAVFAFNRARINAMLEQQFTAAFNASRFITPCSGTVGDLSFSTLVFGAPVLSFEVAEGNDVSARLSIPILAGSFWESQRQAGRSASLARHSDIQRGGGNALRMDIDLELVNSHSDNTGRVSIDLSKARDPVCDLVSDPEQQRAIGEYLLEYLRDQPAHQTTFELAVVDSGSYQPLNPVKFVIRTQAAPGARVAGAQNAGDGAILVFMKLQALDDDSGTLPGADYPYLIPNDQVGGVPYYSAALFLSGKLKPFVKKANVDVLKDSLLPEGYTFSLINGSYIEPHQYAYFGTLAEKRTCVRVEPSQADLNIMETLDFTARRGDGSTVTDVRWTSSCINSPLLKGEISSSGRFSAANYPIEGPPVLMTTVTAHYTEDGRAAEASAFLLVRYYPLRLDPLLSTRAPGGEAVSLEAVGHGATNALGWQLLEPKLGELKDGSGGASHVYTPPGAGGVPMVAQRIQSDATAEGNSAQAVVMLLAGGGAIPVEPPLVSGVYGQGELHFEVPEDVLGTLGVTATAEEDLFWHWSVIGDGSLIAEGRTARFTPPASRVKGAVSVVTCEVLGPSVDHLCGYSLVELVNASDARESPTWESLLGFEVTAPDGAQAFANGMQQIRVRIRLETAAIELDGENVLIPVSPAEMNTLTLVYRDSQGAEVPYIDPNQEGMEFEDGRQWAASVRRNRFNLHPSALGPAQEDPLPASDEGTTYADRYLYLKTDSAVEFYAQFRASTGAIMRSTSLDDPINESITVKGVTPPAVVRDDYSFERKRVWNGEGKIVDDDDFSYMLQSIDFWKLSFLKSGYEPAGFSTLRVEANTSSIQWEAELLDETFFSCTGYVFQPKERTALVPAPTALSFDPYLLAMMEEVEHAQPDSSFHSNPPQPGELIVSLHRESDVKYWYDGMGGVNPMKKFRAVLDRPMVYNLRDENGNRHRMQIGFKDSSLPGSRNELDLIIR